MLEVRNVRTQNVKASYAVMADLETWVILSLNAHPARRFFALDAASWRNKTVTANIAAQQNTKTISQAGSQAGGGSIIDSPPLFTFTLLNLNIKIYKYGKRNHLIRHSAHGKTSYWKLFRGAEKFR